MLAIDLAGYSMNSIRNHGSIIAIIIVITKLLLLLSLFYVFGIETAGHL